MGSCSRVVPCCATHFSRCGVKYQTLYLQRLQSVRTSRAPTLPSMFSPPEPQHAAAVLASLHGALNSFLLSLGGSEGTKAVLHSQLELPPSPPSHAASRASSSSSNALSLVSRSSQPPLAHMSGTWVKDKAASDSMDPVLRLMHVRGVVRQAIKLVKGVNIKTSSDRLTLEVFSVIGWFKVTEHYPLSGEPASWRRRDLRRGTHTGQLRLLPPAAPSPQKALSTTPSKPLSTSGSSEEEAGEQLQGPWGRFAVDLTWSEPLSGTGVDVYELVSPNTLHVHSTLHVGGKEVHNTAVFHRKK